MNQEKLNDVFAYHPPKNHMIAGSHELLREGARVYSEIINTLVPDGHEKDKAVDALREAMYWANAGVALGANNIGLEEAEYLRPNVF